MRINPNDIKIFEEWKETNDYLIQSWFLNQDKIIKKAFESNDLEGFEFDDFQWSGSDMYDIYNAHLEFHEENFEYKLELVIEPENFVDNEVNSLTIILTNFDVENQIPINKIQKDISGSDLTINTLIGLISEIKGME